MNFNCLYSLETDTSSRSLVATGPLGTVVLPIHGGGVLFFQNKLFLPTKSLLSELVSMLVKFSTGLSFGYFVELTLVGLGFRLIKLENVLLLRLGFAHYIKFVVPSDLHVVGYKKRIVVFGLTSSSVNQFVERLVLFRKPDAYKNKGVQVVGRVFRLKIGKQK